MEDFYPLSKRDAIEMPVHGKYDTGYPKGAVVHYTAGKFDLGGFDARREIVQGAKRGFAFLCIDTEGEIYQAHPITQWGYHCGESSYNKVPRGLGLWGTLSNDLIGIEICNAGLLTENNGKLYTWWKEEISKKDARHVIEEEYGCPTGWYHKYTKEQEETLAKFILWLESNDTTGSFSFDHILGHHEISGLAELGYWRKCDPGGSLSMPMSHFRQYLKDRKTYFNVGLK